MPYDHNKTHKDIIDYLKNSGEEIKEATLICSGKKFYGTLKSNGIKSGQKMFAALNVKVK